MHSEKRSAAATADLSDELDRISSRLVDARQQAKPLAQFPGALPDNLSDAYQIQMASISRWPDTVSGWKVGGVPPSFQEQYRADRLAGPVFRNNIKTVDDQGEVDMSIFAGGFAATEAEFVIRLGETITPGDGELSSDELVAYVASIHIGAEIAGSPMADINRMGPGSIISDFGNNGGLVIGPSIRSWQSQLSDVVSISVRVDGALVGTAKTALDQGVMDALKFLVRLGAERGLTLTEGTYVSCGAMTGIHDVTAGSTATVRFEGLGEFSVHFTRKQPAV
ncbi:MAG: 2-keto-4-pentenoate hydratase [Pseudomonadota bacterium]